MKNFLSLFFGTFIFGPIVVVILTALLFLAALRFDVLYDISLFIPRQIGLVNTVTTEEIVKIRDSEMDNVFLEEGRYRIYSNQLIALNTDITILDLENNRLIHATSIPTDNSGLHDNGDPQFIFTLEKTSSYKIKAASLSAGNTNQIDFEIVPYLGNKNSAIALFGGFIQIGIIWLFGRMVYQYLKRDQIEEEKERQRKTSDEIGAFLDDLKK